MTENSTLEMDMNVECSRCLGKGATENGLCLKCITEKASLDDFDTDKKCSVCGRFGTNKDGLCLACVVLKGKHFWGRVIGFYTLIRAKTEICALIDGAAKEIDMAYIKAEGDLTVALSLKLAGTKMAGEVETIATINFVEGRFKRAVRFVVNEKQMDLPGM